MGTHPIFESDFDCLTECLLQLLASRSATNPPTENSNTAFSAASAISDCHAKPAGAHAWSTSPPEKEWAAIMPEPAVSFLSPPFSSLSDGLPSPAFSDKNSESDMESKEVRSVTPSPSGAASLRHGPARP